MKEYIKPEVDYVDFATEAVATGTDIVSGDGPSNGDAFG